MLKKSEKNIKKGFNLLEVLIAISILCVIISFILVSVRGRRNESIKGKNYFTAVSLAQKLLDDIENRCRENIFTVEELIDANLNFSLTDEDSPFFQYLEDTNGDGKLNNDFSISKMHGSLKKQLEKFDCKMSFDRNYGNGVTELELILTWVDGRETHEYKTKHLISDLPEKIEFDPGTPPQISLSESAVAKALFDDQNVPFEELLVKYNISRELAFAIAEIQYVSRSISAKIRENRKKIYTMQHSSKALTKEGVIEIAMVNEESAMITIQGYSMLILPLMRIKKLENEGKLVFGTFFVNRKAIDFLRDLTRLADVVYGKPNKLSLSLNFNLELTKEMNLLMGVLTNSGLKGEISYSKQIGVLDKILNIGTALIQNNNSSMVMSTAGRKILVSSLVTRNFKSLRKLFEGRDYNKTKLINKKINNVRNHSFKEHEDISEALGTMCAVSYQLSNLLETFSSR